jgi:glycosyltransferase involved in cell wall biosynthesis
MENKQPFFSIVIPTWNRADMIAKTLESVLAQTFTNFEVIVVDDGSTDNTKEVVESFTDTRLQYIWQQNAERAAARNNGTRHAQGQYVTFLDSDDLFMPEHLQVVLSNLEKNDFPKFFHQSYQIESVSGVVLWKYLNHYKNPLKKLIKKGNYFGSVGLFIERCTALSCMFDEERVLAGSEDYEMLLRLTLDHSIICGLEITTSVINHENRGEIRVNKEKLVFRVEYLVKKTLKNKDFTSRYKNWLAAFKASNYSFVALHLALHKEKRTAIQFFIKAIKYNPFHLFSKRSIVIFKSLLFK